MPIGRTPGHLSSGTSMLLLYASNEVLGNNSVAILEASFATVFRNLIRALSFEVRSLLHWQESRLQGPCDTFDLELLFHLRYYRFCQRMV